MQVIGLQLDIAWEDPAANYDRACRLLDAATVPEGALVVLPEMFATGFSMSIDRVAEDQHGPTLAFLSRESAARRCYLLAGLATRSTAGRARNECVVVGPDGHELARYCKMQPFTLGGERDYYEPGAAPTIFRWHDCSVAPFICYDLRFPEIFRPVAAQGAELLTVIANWPAARDHHWQALLRARAIENVAYVMGINRAGRDPHTSYSGHSLIVGPDGNTLAAAGEGEEIITATIDRELLANFRRKLPFLADLRTDYVRSI